jgi:hypothetical protein
MDATRAARALKYREHGIISISYRPARAEYLKIYSRRRKAVVCAMAGRYAMATIPDLPRSHGRGYGIQPKEIKKNLLKAGQAR